MSISSPNEAKKLTNQRPSLRFSLLLAPFTDRRDKLELTIRGDHRSSHSPPQWILLRSAGPLNPGRLTTDRVTFLLQRDQTKVGLSSRGAADSLTRAVLEFNELLYEEANAGRHPSPAL